MTETHTPNELETAAWEKVRAAVEKADSLAFDGCHKIYVLMDESGTRTQRGWGYGDGTDQSKLLMVKDTNNPLAVVQDWFRSSCGLRFINQINGTGNENEHFTALIGQGDENDWYPEDDDPYWSLG